MDKKRTELIITVLLVIILIFAWSRGLGLLRSRKASVSMPEQAVVMSQQDNIQGSLPDKNTFSGIDWGRCPFSGAIISGKGKVAQLKLSGIFQDDKGMHALVNDEIVQPGDSIASYRVTRIKSNSIIVNDGSQDIEIHLEQ